MKRLGKQTEAVARTGSGPVTREPGPDTGPKVGEWYWVRGKNWDDDDTVKHWFGCVVRLGSNYAKVEGLRGSLRIHFNEFAGLCTREPLPQDVIAHKIGQQRVAIAQLLERVKEITAALGIAPRALGEGETQAIALRGGGTPIEDYKKALVKAEAKTLRQRRRGGPP